MNTRFRDFLGELADLYRAPFDLQDLEVSVSRFATSTLCAAQVDTLRIRFSDLETELPELRGIREHEPAFRSIVERALKDTVLTRLSGQDVAPSAPGM